MINVLYDMVKSLFVVFLKIAHFFGLTGFKIVVVVAGILSIPAIIYIGFVGGFWFLGKIAEDETFQDICKNGDAAALGRALYRLEKVIGLEKDVAVLC